MQAGCVNLLEQATRLCRLVTGVETFEIQQGLPQRRWSGLVTAELLIVPSGAVEKPSE